MMQLEAVLKSSSRASTSPRSPRSTATKATHGSSWGRSFTGRTAAGGGSGEGAGIPAQHGGWTTCVKAMTTGRSLGTQTYLVNIEHDLIDRREHVDDTHWCAKEMKTRLSRFLRSGMVLRKAHGRHRNTKFRQIMTTGMRARDRLSAALWRFSPILFVNRSAK
jgi:hypothetical protein